MSNLKGPEGVWANLRFNNRCYVPNKVFSVMLSATLAGITLRYKPLVYDYTITTGTYDYTIIYWVLFLFYSFQALDECIEMYSSLAEREKGALGLLFEMN